MIVDDRQISFIGTGRRITKKGEEEEVEGLTG
jgi:hypothetical protein